MDNFTKKWQDFHEGNLSKKEAVEFIHFLESDLGIAMYQSHLKKTWADQEKLIPRKSSPNPTPSFPNLKSSNSGNAKRDAEREISSIKLKNIFTYFKYAACLLAFLLILNTMKFFAGSTKDSIKVLPETVWIRKSNPQGIKSKIRLPDSSWVYLNAGSQIRYKKNFIENRYVVLEGEAFFEVFEDKNHPFVVEASHVKTLVLGTSFNINSYYPESVEVGLATGALKIMDESTGKELLLAPGEGSSVKSTSGEMEKYKVDPKLISQWKDGILHFNEESFDRVIKKLEDWYGVQITVTGKLPEETCNGTFDKNTYQSNVLKVLAHALSFSFEIDQNQVIIHTK